MNDFKGFTVIELAVVVFILGLVVAIAGTNILDRTDINLKSASRNLSGTIKYLYNESIFKKNIYKLAFDVEKGEYWGEVLEGDKFIRKQDFIFKKRSLPFGVNFSGIDTERIKREADSEEDIFLLFLPSGYVDPATIHLKTGVDNHFTLSTNPYTGVTQVHNEHIDFYEHYSKLVNKKW